MRDTLLASLLLALLAVPPAVAQEHTADHKQASPQAHAAEAGTLERVPLRFHNLGLDAGLSISSVSDVVQDEHGYIWLATIGGGIDRYDTRWYEKNFCTPATTDHDGDGCRDDCTEERCGDGILDGVLSRLAARGVHVQERDERAGELP